MSRKKLAESPASHAAQEWTVMVYMSSDNDLGSECVWALTEMQTSQVNAPVAVIAQFDAPTRGVGTKRYDFTGANAISHNAAAPLQLEDFEIANFADDVTARPVFTDPAKRKRIPVIEENFARGTVLAEFVEKGIERYPANHYLLVLSGYGNGPLGGLLTEGNPVSSMTLAELGRALEKVRQDHLKFLAQAPKGEFDILGLDTCLMGMTEVVSELTGTVRYVVANEGLSPATGWPYRRLLEAISADPTMTPKTLTGKIVDTYIGYYSDYLIAGISVDQSVLDLSQAKALETAIQALVESLTKTENGVLRLNKGTGDEVVLAHWKAQTYRFDQHVDLWDFCDCLAQSTTNEAVRKACQQVQDAVDACVIKTEHNGAAFQHSHGLSVYFPWSFSDLDAIQEYSDLTFARRTRWGSFLAAYVKETQRELRGGFKLKQQALIFPQDGYFESRDNPKIGDMRDNPKIGDMRDNPKIGDMRDNPKIGDMRDNPKIGDMRDNPKIGDMRDNPKIGDMRDLMGEMSNGVMVFAPKMKNPPAHYYKRPRPTAPKPNKTGAGKKKA